MGSTTIGIDLGGTKVLMLCGDVEDRSETGPDFSPAALEERLRAFVSRLGVSPDGIGLAVPGLVDLAGRIGVCDGLHRFTGWNPQAAFADFDCKVAIANDVKAALAEEMHDTPPGATVGVVMAGTSVGAAFITEGRPLLGACGWAGELGHLPMFIDGSVKRLDELAGGSFIASGLGISSGDLARRASEGDATALEAIRKGGFALGLGLAAVINLLNPSRLAAGGGALSLPGYWEAAREATARHSIPEMSHACRLYQVRAGARVVAKGAIRLALA
jgi:predicted NBD/HSP70 family sugar kinase